MKNEIIEEVREARAALAAEHGYDRQRIYEWARATTAAHEQAQRTPSPNKKGRSEGEARTFDCTFWLNKPGGLR